MPSALARKPGSLGVAVQLPEQPQGRCAPLGSSRAMTGRPVREPRTDGGEGHRRSSWLRMTAERVRFATGAI